MKSVKKWLNDNSAKPQHSSSASGKGGDNKSSQRPSPQKQKPFSKGPGRQDRRPKRPYPPKKTSRVIPYKPSHKPAPRPSPRPQGTVPQAGGFPIRVYPLGGFEQIGRNCFVVEVEGDIYLIDLGLQFPDEGMLGIDYLIPDISSLSGRENKIKGIFFTHGHLDHIGAAQHLLPKLHYPPCYGTKLTMAFIKKRLDEEKITSKANLNTVPYGQKIRIGKIEVEFLKVTHSIPDSAAVAIHTKYGTIMHTGDFKFDLTPTSEEPADFQRLADQSKNGVLAIIADSTNANKPGFSKSEAEISETLFKMIRDAEGRLIISTFSSLLNRIHQVVAHAQKFNRKIFISGRSMVTNVEIAQNLGYLKAPRGLIRKAGPAMDKLPDNQVIIITTGSQGEEMAGLARIGLGTHRQIGVKKGDTVVLSSNPIVGNERAISKVINNLNLQGATVKTNAEFALHTTGHGMQQDILLMHQLVRAKHVIPEHGEPHMRAAHAELARKIGYPDNRIHMMTNGEILEFDAKGNARRSKQKLTLQDVVIDGYGSAGEGQRIMDDRKIMSSNGVIVIALKAYAESKRLVGDPDILARGLIYGSEQTEITGEAIKIAKKAYEESLNRGESDRKGLKRAVNGALFRFFDRKLNRKPMIIPIVIEV